MKLEKKIAKWSDEEVLEAIYMLVQRANISTRFVYDDNGILTHHAVVVTCGDKFFTSSPQPVEWPMQPIMPPEGTKYDS